MSLNAPANPRTKNNELPLQLAQLNNHTECANLLEQYETPLPKTCRTLWYHGTLGRNEAVTLIQENGNKDDSFLVRFSNRNGGCYVLTMLHDQQIFHFIIKQEVRFVHFYFIAKTMCTE